MAAAIEAEDHVALTSRTHMRHKRITNARFGERIIHLVKVPINDSSGAPRYILGMAVDLTEQTAGLKLDLLHSITRSDILDQLAVIMNSLERAQLKTTEDAMQAFFDNTIGSVESIRNQIGFMRALQDLGIVSPKWQYVATAFEDATTLLPAHSIDIQEETGDFEVYADPLLPRVFYNLLENSLRHGGPRMTKICLSAHIAGDSLHLIYTDNGIGIPLDQKQKIFEFRQVSGTGMGLFLVREILGFTAITIAENGEPGHGVQFEIVVPKGKFRPSE
jgi:signal transduction histidine kinase